MGRYPCGDEFPEQPGDLLQEAQERDRNREPFICDGQRSIDVDQVAAEVGHACRARGLSDACPKFF